MNSSTNVGSLPTARPAIALAAALAILAAACDLGEQGDSRLSAEAQSNCASIDRKAANGQPDRGFELALCAVGDQQFRQITDRRTSTVLRLSEPPQRVVSQSLGSDETLFALLTENERERLVAVSALSTSPEYSDHVDQAAAVGQFVTDKTEQIVSLAPDLVFAASYSTRETIRQLQNANVPTVVLHQFGGIDDAISNIEVTAFALFEDAAGQLLINSLTEQIKAARQRLAPTLERAPLRVLAYGSASVYAQGTTFDDLATRLELANIPGQEQLRGWPTAHAEQLLTWRPDIIYLAESNSAEPSAAGAFRRDFSTLFTTEKTPELVVLPNKLMTTVSHRLGELASAIAESTIEAAQRRAPP